MPEAVMSSSVTEDAFLGGALSIRQPASGYRAGVDAVLLAATVATAGANSARVLDMGAGVGTVGLSVARRLGASVEVVLLEMQQDLADLAEENVRRNSLSANVRVVRGDIEADAAALTLAGIGPDSFDQVLANPPFHRVGNGTAATDPIRAAAHAMPIASLERWVRVMARVVRPGGVVTLIHKAEALPELLAAMDRRFGRLRVLPIQPRANAPAIRVIVQAQKASRAPLVLLPPFVLHDDGQDFTPSASAILRRGAALSIP